MAASPDLPVKAKRRQENILLQLFILLVFFGAVYFVLDRFGVFRPRGETPHEVTFRVEGSASAATISYTREDGAPSERFDAGLPWHKTVKYTQPTTVILTATNPTQVGTLKCILLLDGEPWKKAQTEGSQDKISCAGAVP